MVIDKYCKEMKKHFKDWCEANDVKYIEATLDDMTCAGYITDKGNIEGLNLLAIKYVLANTQVVTVDELRVMTDMLSVIFINEVNSLETSVYFTGIRTDFFK